MRVFDTSAGAVVLAILMTSGTPATASPQPPQATASPTLQERLGRVRDEVFTRPDRRDLSVKELHQILTIDPTLAEAHLLLGLIHVGRGTAEMRAEAAAEFRQALAVEPGLTPARFYLARTYLELGQVDRAREELVILVESAPGQAQFLATLGETERRLGNAARAGELARQALAVDPTFLQARYYLALALADLGRKNEAIVELERVAKADPSIADVHISLGVAYFETGRTDEAIAALTRGIRLAPPKPDARIFLARAYRVNGLLTQAEAQLKLALPPGSRMEASAYYQHIEADLLIERGLIRLQQNLVTAARQAFEEAVRLSPDLGLAHRHLAVTLLRQGLAALAASEAAKAEKLGAPVTAETKSAIDAALARGAKGGSK